jgi:hypothetical protein
MAVEEASNTVSKNVAEMTEVSDDPICLMIWPHSKTPWSGLRARRSPMKSSGKNGISNPGKEGLTAEFGLSSGNPVGLADPTLAAAQSEWCVAWEG